MEDNSTIGTLFQRYLNDECTRDEVEILLQYFGAGENEAHLTTLVRHELESRAGKTLPTREVVQYLVNTTFDNVKRAVATGNETSQPPTGALYRQRWFILGAAIVLLLLISAIAVFIFR
ncbi:MAG: hypothetical protein ABI416_01900 [Ginsengibacter sp.]